MREVNRVKREKVTYNLQLNELIKGDWLELISINKELVEFEFKNNYLTIKWADVKSVKEEKESGE